jgi:hypothetical protein
MEAIDDSTLEYVCTRNGCKCLNNASAHRFSLQAIRNPGWWNCFCWRTTIYFRLDFHRRLQFPPVHYHLYHSWTLWRLIIKPGDNIRMLVYYLTHINIVYMMNRDQLVAELSMDILNLGLIPFVGFFLNVLLNSSSLVFYWIGFITTDCLRWDTRDDNVTKGRTEVIRSADKSNFSLDQTSLSTTAIQWFFGLRRASCRRFLTK